MTKRSKLYGSQVLLEAMGISSTCFNVDCRGYSVVGNSVCYCLLNVEQETIKEPWHPQEAVFPSKKLDGEFFVSNFGNKIV